MSITPQTLGKEIYELERARFPDELNPWEEQPQRVHDFWERIALDAIRIMVSA